MTSTWSRLPPTSVTGSRRLARTGEHDGRDDRQPAASPAVSGVDVPELYRGHDRQRDHDRFEHQHGGAEPAHRGPLIAPGLPGVRRRVSSSLASPAVITEPAISTTVPAAPARGPARPASGRPAARRSPRPPRRPGPTASSMASSRRSATCTRSGPNTGLASSASSGRVHRPRRGVARHDHRRGDRLQFVQDAGHVLVRAHRQHGDYLGGAERLG